MPLTPEEQRQARRKAMGLLEHMDRTEKGLSDRLRQAGFSEEAVADAMAYVCSYGYIDDARYAENYIIHYIETKSRQKILQELCAKGIDRSTATEAWERCCEMLAPDETRILQAAIEKKYSPDTVLDEKAMRRLLGYLLRRGFQYADISRVLARMNITSNIYENQNY